MCATDRILLVIEEYQRDYIIGIDNGNNDYDHPTIKCYKDILLQRNNGAYFDEGKCPGSFRDVLRIS